MGADLAPTAADVKTPTPASPRDSAFGRDDVLSTLLVASGHQDEAAFARFYQLTSPWIHDLMRRRRQPVTTTEDATRLVYVTGWRRAAGFVPLEQSALVWLTTIAYELAQAARRGGPEPELAQPGCS